MDKEKPQLLDEILNHMENTEESLVKCVTKLKAINEKANNALMHVENQNSQILNIDKNDTVFSFSTGTYQTMAHIIELFYNERVSSAACTTTNNSTTGALNSYCNTHRTRQNVTISNFRKLKTFSENLAEIVGMVKSMQLLLNKTNDDDDDDDDDDNNDDDDDISTAEEYDEYVN